MRGLQANPDNALLQYRGNAGSHDLGLGTATLEALVAATSPDTAVAVPRYDKSQNAGRGDRAPQDAWPQVKGPVDVVLFEGWMLGFAPIQADAAAAVSPDLLSVNEFLQVACAS
jgi:D-glycerate 3-kinase